MSAQLTALLAAILWLQATAVPAGNHTCTGVVKHPVNVLVNVTEPVTFRSYTWCLRVPPRCSKYTVQLKDRVKLHVEMHNKTITVCCEGYVEMEGKCVPACPPGADCPFMRCNRTNHCHCTPGYTGLYCNEACPRGLWGKDCKRPCDCPSGYTCHHLTGDCFVDDRPPRRTTTPKTTTTTVRPTTTITTPTTEGTTLETVKTPVFRFPPPPWVESATNTKKTTTRQVKKEEAQPTKVVDLIQETSEMITKKTLFEISLPALATVQMPNKTSIERTTTIELFSSQSNEEKVNQKAIYNSTNFKEQETIEEFPMKPTLSTTSSTEKSVSQSIEENSIKKSVTFLNEITTTVPTSPRSEFQNTLQLSTVTAKTPLPINFSTNYQNNTRFPPAVTTVHSPAVTDHVVSTHLVTTKLPNVLPQTPVEAVVTATTQPILYNTRPAENTFENEIQTQMVPISIDNHTTEGILQTTTLQKITSLEPKPTLSSTVAVPSIESPSTTKQIMKVNENINEKKTTLENHNVPTMPVIKLTKSIHPEDKYFTRTLSDLETSSENMFKIKNTPFNSNFNNNIPFTLIQGFTLSPITSNVSVLSSSKIPNYDTTNDPISTSSTPPTTYDYIVSKRTTPFPNLAHVTTTAATTISNLLTTPTTLTTSTADPTMIKSHLSSTTTTKLPRIEAQNTSSPFQLPRTIIPSNFRKIATTAIPAMNIIPLTSPQISTPATLVFTSTTEQTTVTPLETESPTTMTKIKASTFPFSKELSEKEYNYATVEPQIIETEPIIEPTPGLPIDVFKDFNAHKKLKPNETHGSYSGQDKPKKKHEKIKPKTINAKEFPLMQQSKTEKHDETILLPTTEISLRSILKAETFRSMVTTTKSPKNTKMQPPPSDVMNIHFVTDERRAIETASSGPTSKPNQIWYALKKQNFSNEELKEQDPLPILKEPSEISELSLVSTEMNREMESNTIDYRQSSEEPMKKLMAQDEETNYSLIFNKIKFNMTDSIAAGVKLSKTESSYIHLPMILVLGIALLTLLLLTLTLWMYLKRRRQQAEPFPPCIMAYAMEEPLPMDCDSYDQAFFCPTFTNTYAERINRELRELNYDHPRRSQPEPLYAEIFN